MEERKALCQTPVLLIFFARPKQFAKVFEAVKKARPKELFLYQDGPRANRPDDIKNINECRSIAEQIDWECTVHKKYQKDNFGCDPSEFIAQKWAFSIVDKCIVLEDDDVPGQAFFPFCTELLERYENDYRINMICGMNNIGVYHNTPYSYVFTKRGSIWGWASWRRVIDAWDGSYGFLDGGYQEARLAEALTSGGANAKSWIKEAYKKKAEGKEYYEYINAASQLLNNQLNIVPKYNLMSNIGIGENGVHSPSSMKQVNSATQKLYYMKTYDIKFPLQHPEYVSENEELTDGINLSIGSGHPIISRVRSFEGRIRQFLFR